MPESAPDASRFDDWELRPQERALFVRGRRVAVGSRAFSVLTTLVQGLGRVVTKEELLDSAWPGLVVEENNVSVQIAALRKLIGAHAITTISGVGYRLSCVPLPAVSIETVPGKDHPVWPPPLESALVGRESDVTALLKIVGFRPLVTITGPGGVGKTSVAKVLHDTLDEQGWSTCWVDLAPIREPGEWVEALARALGIDLSGSIQPEKDLVSALGSSGRLLALDNCEHLAAPVARVVGQAMASARNVRWLTTSQEPLQLAGEVVYRLDPLGLPNAGTKLEECLTHGAMELFCKLATAADHRFTLDAANLPLAIDLCQQLEGLPLAIEMAAARVPMLGLEGVRAQLERRLQLPSGRRDAPTRHHTLRSTLDWSYGLLTERERSFFRRLEPFLGGFTAEMAADAASEPETPADAARMEGTELLAALVNKSLVQRGASPGRYQLFESAREYARERAAEAGESSLVRRRHAEALGRWFAHAESDYQTLPDADWAARYRLEWHNARAALAWACSEGDADVLAILVAAVGRLDSFAQSPCEIVDAGIPLSRLLSASPALRASACIEFSWAHYAEGNRETGTQLALRALDDYRQLGDNIGEYRALAQLVRLYESRPGHTDQTEAAWAALCRIDDSRVPLRTRLTCAINSGLFYSGTRTVSKLRELESVSRASGFESLAEVCKVHVTDQLLIESRFSEAAEQALRYLDDGTSGPRMTALLRHNLCLALVHLDRSPEARDHAREAVRIMPGSAYLAVDTFAFAAAREGKLERAAVLSGYADRIKRERDERADPAEARIVAETAKRLAEGVAVARLDELLKLGAGMSPTQSLALAFDF